MGCAAPQDPAAARRTAAPRRGAVLYAVIQKWGGLRGRADVRQQAHVAGALDGAGDHALLHRVGAGALARLDLAVAAEQLAQRFSVLVVDVNRAAGSGSG